MSVNSRPIGKAGRIPPASLGGSPACCLFHCSNTDYTRHIVLYSVRLETRYPGFRALESDWQGFHDGASGISRMFCAHLISGAKSSVSGGRGRVSNTVASKTARRQVIISTCLGATAPPSLLAYRRRLIGWRHLFPSFILISNFFFSFFSAW